MLLTISLKDEVLSNDFSNFNCKVSRETDEEIFCGVATDLCHRIGAMDMYIPTFSTVADEEDFLVMYHYEDADSVVLLRGYVLKSE